ncbi:transposase [Burkholderia plantarii]|uniref:Transposase n=1 Tax=Burkholderia plantarii TaxID=41899 RepID=A0A0B6RZC7_BURPL|nr:transposase [Burkholderia plantarii]
MAQQVRRHERVRREAPERTGGRKQQAEEVARGIDAGERSHSRGATKKVVSAPSRRDLVRRRLERATCVAGDRHERQRLSLSARAGPQSRLAGADRRIGAAAPSLWLGHDLSEAAAVRHDRKPQARGAVVRARETAGAPPQAQEGSGCATPAIGPAVGSQSGVVNGFCVRPHG